MKKTPIVMILSFFALSFLLTGCSLFQKEDISVDTGALLEIEDVVVEEIEEAVVETGNLDEELEDDVDYVAGEDDEEEIVETGSELELTIRDLIKERKETLGDGDELTEEDIKLMEDILNELINAVE